MRIMFSWPIPQFLCLFQITQSHLFIYLFSIIKLFYVLAIYSAHCRRAMALFVFILSIFLPLSPIFGFNCQPQLNELNLFDPSDIGPDHFIELSSSTSINSNCAIFGPPLLTNYALAMIDLSRGIVFTADFSRITTVLGTLYLVKMVRIESKNVV